MSRFPSPRQYLMVGVRDSLPTAGRAFKDQLTMLRGGSGVADALYVCRETATDGTYEWLALTDDVTVTNLTVNSNTTLGNGDEDTTTIRGHLVFDGTAPTITARAAAGTGATVTKAGTAASFRVTLTIGTGPTTGPLITVTFARAFASAEYEVVTSAGDAEAALSSTNWYVDVATQTASGFTVNVQTALATGASLRLNFHVFGGT
jgi:hypothetical protein